MDTIDRKITTLIRKFDKTIIPYSDYDLFNLENTTEDKKFSVIILEDENGKKVSTELKASDNKTSNELRYKKENDSFMYAIKKVFDQNLSFLLIHFGDSNNEKIIISYYGNGMNEDLNIIYDLKTKLIGQDNIGVSDSNKEEKEYVYKEILNAIRYVEETNIFGLQNNDNTTRTLAV